MSWNTVHASRYILLDESGTYALIRKLITAGTYLDATDIDGISATREAAHARHLKLAVELVNASAKIELDDGVKFQDIARVCRGGRHVKNTCTASEAEYTVSVSEGIVKAPREGLLTSGNDRLLPRCM